MTESVKRTCCNGRPCVHSKEYNKYEQKIELFLENDKRLNKYNELVIKLNEKGRRTR